MERLTYGTGEVMKLGDVVKRGPRAQATYQIDRIILDGAAPIIWLAPCSGYTSASVYGWDELARLVLVEQPTEPYTARYSPRHEWVADS